MFSRSGVRQARAVGRRFNSHGAHHHAEQAQSEVNVPKALGGFVLAGIALYFYRSTKDEPIIQTPLYKQNEDRPNLRNETYLEKYKTSFIKGFIKDKGGIGQKHLRRQTMGSVPQTLIPAHSPAGNQFGAGIKLEELGPRRQQPRYFAPLK